MSLFFGKMTSCCFLYGVSYRQELTVFLDMFSTKFTDLIINSMTKMRFIGAIRNPLNAFKRVLINDRGKETYVTRKNFDKAR